MRISEYLQYLLVSLSYQTEDLANSNRTTTLRQAKENRHPNTGSRRPSPFGGGAPSPANSLDRRMRVSPAGAGRPQYSNSFAQVLGSRITPPPPIFQVRSSNGINKYVLSLSTFAI